MIAATSLRSRYTTAFCIALLLVFAARASAGLIDPNHLPKFTMQVEGAPDPWTWAPPVNAFAATPDGYQLRNVYQALAVCDGRADVKVDLLKFNPDPFVLNNLLVTNTTAIPQIFTVTTGLPTSFAAPNNISGTITTSLIAGNATGSATISTVPGQSIYKGQIDFVTVHTLQDDPFSLTTSTSTASSANFGPTFNAIPVNSNIAIQVTFSLSPGDTASILSRFDVTAVPEPSSAACIGAALALAAGTFSRRRRSRRPSTSALASASRPALNF